MTILLLRALSCKDTARALLRESQTHGFFGPTQKTLQNLLPGPSSTPFWHVRLLKYYERGCLRHMKHKKLDGAIQSLLALSRTNHRTLHSTYLPSSSRLSSTTRIFAPLACHTGIPSVSLLPPRAAKSTLYNISRNNTNPTQNLPLNSTSRGRYPAPSNQFWLSSIITYSATL